MGSHLNRAGRGHDRVGAHRKPRKGRSAFARTVAASGAAICIGAAYDLSTPSADALSILLPGPTVNGVGNTTRINILEGNIFNPQLGITGGTSSSNRTIGNVITGQGNNIINQLLSAQLNLAGATGNGNTTQINILSYNIFNPQFSFIGPNISNNTSVNNVAMNNGNNSATAASSGGGLLPWLGGAAGNGNTTQFSFFSGNIFNPQWSMLGGGNISNNTTFTNVAIGNGNFSQATLSAGGWFATFLFGGGNGNTNQFGFFVSNIYNPQFTFGGGNISNNTAGTNTANGNGNNSSNDATGGGVGTTGNGNTNQGAVGAGNINNDQVNIGPGSATTVTTTTTPDPVTVLLSTQSASTTTTASDTESRRMANGTGDTDDAADGQTASLTDGSDDDTRPTGPSVNVGNYSPTAGDAPVAGDDDGGGTAPDGTEATDETESDTDGNDGGGDSGEAGD